MKNITIINGAQCTGKSIKLNEILSEFSDEKKLVVDTKTFLNKKFKVNDFIKVIAIDEVVSKDINECLAKSFELGKRVILVTTNGLLVLPKTYLSKVDVIACERVF